MSNGVRFQVALPGDAPAICDLVNSAYRGEGSKRGWTTEADLLDGQRTDLAGIEDILSASDQIILTARTGTADEIVGCVNLVKQGGACYLGMLTVNPLGQGQGLGKGLMAQAESWAREQKCQSIRMTVITLRKELLEFYVRRGFTRTGELSPFPYGDERFGAPRRTDLAFETLVKAINP